MVRQCLLCKGTGKQYRDNNPRKPEEGGGFTGPACSACHGAGEFDWEEWTRQNHADKLYLGLIAERSRAAKQAKGGGHRLPPEVQKARDDILASSENYITCVNRIRGAGLPAMSPRGIYFRRAILRKQGYKVAPWDKSRNLPRYFIGEEVEDAG